MTPHQKALEEALIALGFERPSGPNVLIFGVFHPDLNLGVQVVSGHLMDGKADLDRILIVDLGGATLSIIAVEDLIADRMGQAYASTPPRNDMIDQAFKLYQLAERLDDAYLDRRICEETHAGATLAMLRQHGS